MIDYHVSHLAEGKAMFEAVELDRTISKATYKTLEPGIRTRLLQLQGEIQQANIPVILIVSGVEGAGKSHVVNRLNEWMDTRGIETYAFWDETDEERERPYLWRFWRSLPPRGKIGIMFGSWYTQPIVQRTFEKIDDTDFEKSLKRINELERTLILDGALIVKLWFHIKRDTQRKRIKEKYKGRKGKTLEEKFAKHYKRFEEISEHAIRLTDTGSSPWWLIEAENKRYRDICAGQTLIDAMSNRLQMIQNESNTQPELHHTTLLDDPKARTTILDHVDLNKALDSKEYAEKLNHYQSRLKELAWEANNQNRSVVLVFEGWDAAGKGGAIRRVTAAIDARLYRVISVSAPSDEEKAHHYLWRFWRQIPRGGYLTIYDRSWYGRVLVERVEGFAQSSEWQRAYREINEFEEQLIEHGIIVIKYWLHIDKEEQLRRFKERQQVPWKQYKLTDEDWRNRERWDDYKAAVNDMISKTSTAKAPWHIIPANNKKYARTEVLKTLCERLQKHL